MSNSDNMKNLLKPLGVYKLEESFLGAELDCIGAAMDRMEAYLERVQREMCLLTAREEGLQQAVQLFRYRPAAQQPEELARAVAALMRIGDDGFTLSALQDTLTGCGLHVRLDETGITNTVDVRFPDVPGVPEQFDRIRVIVETILPAHLQVRYMFWYQTWQEIEQKGTTWQSMEDQKLSWDMLETMVI